MNVAVNQSNTADAQPVADSSVPWQYKILTLSFNQDCTSLAMGTLNSYALFAINLDRKIDDGQDCDIQPLRNIPYQLYEEVHIIERLFSSSLIALVSQQAPRRLKVCHFKKGSEICTYSFASSIHAVKLNRTRLIVCLEENIHIHNMRDMKLLHVIRELPSNVGGICALASNEANPYLAYPASGITGEVQVFDTINLKPVMLISAHESPLAAIAFDTSGTRIATASNRGTVIRVHNAVDGVRLFEFRRGVRRSALVYSLAFSPDSQFLATSCNTGTIHIFRLVDAKEKAPEESTTWMGSFNRLVGGMAHYLPRHTSEVLTQDRAFATVHLPSSGAKTITAMNTCNKTLKLFVAGFDGFVLVYEINLTEGGECKQTNQYQLFNLSQIRADASTSANPSSDVYPSNRLRTDKPAVPPLPSTLTNTQSRHDPTFQTAMAEQSFPPLASVPSEN